MEVTVYNQQGKKSGTTTLPEGVFNVPWNADLVHQVVVAMEANARQPVAHAKDRSEVSGGGKKPWMQKGTGRARHGSSRSPIWRTGGATHGPRNDKDYSQKVNKKMRAKALLTVLSQKTRDGEVLFVDTLAFDAPKTAQAKEALSALAQGAGADKLTTKKKNTALVLLSEYNETTAKSFRNLGHVEVDELRNVNPVDLLRYTYVVIENPDSATTFFEQKQGAKTAAK